MASKKKQRKKGYKLCHTQGCLADKAEVFMFLYQEVIITLIQYASQMKREGLYKLYSFQVLKTQGSLVKVCMVNFCRKTISLFFNPQGNEVTSAFIFTLNSFDTLFSNNESMNSVLTRTQNSRAGFQCHEMKSD